MLDASGYRGRSLDLLKKSDAGVGDVVEATTEYGTVTGTLVPRYEYDDEHHIVLKLKSGYNIGLNVAKLRSVKRTSVGEKPSYHLPPPPKPANNLPRVSILGTGGTIASRVDYRTGAVQPAITSEELYALIPELSQTARIHPEILFSLLSENIEPGNWSRLSEKVEEQVADGADGVVITHGTDTMGYTAAALSFALQGVPVPVILVGAQRSSDRPSTDSVLNLLAAVSVAARAEFAGVYVAMHLNESDGTVAIHGGTRVRKDHTSARSAFQSIGVPPAALWTREGIREKRDDLPRRAKAAKFTAKPKFDPNTALLKFYPSMPAAIVDSVVRSGAKAIVFEGTGLGHINANNIAPVKKFIGEGGLAFMTSQCLNGRVDLNVYATGRDLIEAGVTPLEDMLSETALVKAMWALANTKTRDEARALMTENLVGEITERTLQ